MAFNLIALEAYFKCCVCIKCMNFRMRLVYTIIYRGFTCQTNLSGWPTIQAGPRQRIGYLANQ
jgi:hypothetical protein